MSGSMDSTGHDETQFSVAQSTLNDYEQKVWDEWNRQDAELDSRDSRSPAANTVSSELMERRENAHRKLVQYAETALSANENKTGHESSIEETPASREASDSNNISDAVPEDTVATRESAKLSLSQRRILEKFSSTLKLNGMEVLKLNRDKKWQTRFLVVSREVLWLNAEEVNGHSGDRGQCPLGILWTKRFNAGKDYSITVIDRQGRGGMHFDQLTKVSASGRSNLGHALSKKQQEKFKDSVAISVDFIQNGSPKCVVLLCRTTDEAHFLCTGLRVVMDVLKRENSFDEI